MVAPASKREDDDDVEDFYDPNLDPDRYEGVHIVTSIEEAKELFHQRAMFELGISGDEFLRRWDNGDYGAFNQIPDTSDGRRILRVALLIPTFRFENA